MKEKKLVQRLREIADETTPSLRREVAEEVFSNSYEKVADFFNDLLNYGCVSGMVGKLIYYHDTHSFFQTYYDEIDELRREFEEQGVNLKPQGDLMNWYAWFAFEETARAIAQELGIIS